MKKILLESHKKSISSAIKKWHASDLKLDDKEWLRLKYLDERLSAREIGRICNANHSTVLLALKRFGIERRLISESIKIWHTKNPGIVAKENNPNWRRSPTKKVRDRISESLTGREYKRCSQCKKRKERKYFMKHLAHSDGLASACKDCMREHYAKNKSEINAQKRLRRSRPEVKAQEKEYKRQYVRENMDMILAYNRKYRTENPEWVKQIAKKYYRENKKRFLLNAQKRKSRIKNLPASLTQKEWEFILLLYANRCYYCGNKLNGLIIKEHKIPVSRGGGLTKENIVPACEKCNGQKHKRTEREYYQFLRTSAA